VNRTSRVTPVNRTSRVRGLSGVCRMIRTSGVTGRPGRRAAVPRGAVAGC